MKRFIGYLFFIIITLTLSVSCSDKTKPAEMSTYIRDESLELKSYSFEQEPEALAVYKNIAFALSDGKILRIDLSTGESADILNLNDVVLLNCNGSRLLAVQKNSINIFDYDGNEVLAVPVENSLESVFEAAFSEDCILLSVFSDPDDDLYIVQTDSGKMTALPDTWKLNADDAIVFDLALSGSCIKICYAHNFSHVGSNTTVVEYDYIKDEILSETTGSDINYTNGHFGVDGIYYYENSSYTVDGEFQNMYIYSLETDGIATYVDWEKLTKAKDINYSDTVVKYADGTNFVVYNESEKLIITCGLNAEEKPLVILGLDSQEYDELIARYVSSSGRQVQTLNYSKQEYNDRLRTKLLAEESSFDLYIADQTVLRSILENSAFEPLDGYHEVSDNFDNVLTEGVRGLMSYQNKLFGVPLSISYCAAFSKVEQYEIPEKWTIDDMFEICEGMKDSGYKLFSDRYQLTQTVKCYLQDMISQDGKIDEAELAEFFEKLKKYNDLGVLCDGNSSGVLSYGRAYYSPLSLFMYSYLGESINCPTRSGVSYLTLESTLIENPYSKNKDAAAEFIEFLTSENSVYMSDILGIYLGKDTDKNFGFDTLEKAQQELLKFSMELYSDSSYTTIDGNEHLPEFIASEVLLPLLDGKIDPGKAAQAIIDEVAYTYFE